MLDLGCGPGEQAQALAARGARVIGVDLNRDALDLARARRLPRAEFREADLLHPAPLGGALDGLWSSYAPAYLVDLAASLAGWCRELVPGGFVALLEIDDLFGHEPLSARTKTLFAGYAREALAAGRYDFQMGRKLGAHLERAGLEVARTWTLPDAEFAFDGKAAPQVLEAWGVLLERMKLLQAFCGPEYPRLRDEFLSCLARDDHRSEAGVHAALAFKP